MIEFYRLESESPNMRKVSIMLAETGLPFTNHYVEKSSHVSGDDPDPYRAISPTGGAPAIVDRETGAAIFESGAILIYLAEKAGMLLPTTIPERSDVLKWLMFEAANIGPTMVEIRHHLLEDDDDGAEARLRRHQERLSRCYRVLDDQLRDRPYLAGDYSIADIAHYPWSTIVEDMASLSLTELPHLGAWIDRIGGRPALRSV